MTYFVYFKQIEFIIKLQLKLSTYEKSIDTLFFHFYTFFPLYFLAFAVPLELNKY